jgi:hypothetical protein
MAELDLPLHHQHDLAFAHPHPQAGLLTHLRRVLLGDQVKRSHISDHGAFMRSLGRAWAIPMTLVFSTGALITLGQTQITQLVTEYQHHQPLNYVTLALLAITGVIVGGMDLTLLNSAVELRDARLRGVDPSTDPYTRGARLRVWLVSLIESATFMSVAYQLEKPPSLRRWVCDFRGAAGNSSPRSFSPHHFRLPSCSASPPTYRVGDAAAAALPTTAPMAARIVP